MVEMETVKTEMQRYTEMVMQEWRTEIQNDAEFGGINYECTLTNARTALAIFDPYGDLRQLLNHTYWEYHPDVVRLAARVGQAINKRKLLVTNEMLEPTELSLVEEAKRVYGHHNKKVMHHLNNYDETKL